MFKQNLLHTYLAKCKKMLSNRNFPSSSVGMQGMQFISCHSREKWVGLR